MRSSFLSQRRTSQSKIVEGSSVANVQHIITPNSRKKRTVYHTPALIQTVVEEDEIPPPVIVQAPVIHRAAPLPMRTVSLPPKPVTLHPIQRVQPIQIVQNRRVQTVHRAPSIAPTSRSVYNSRDFGVKVREDLSSIRPPTIHEQEVGFCHRVYVSSVACCRFFRCPIWVCCLIPLLIILALIGGAYWRRVHMGTTEIETRKQNINLSLDRLKQRERHRISNKNMSKEEIVAPIVQQPMSRRKQSGPIDDRSRTSKDTDIVNPIVSTDTSTNISDRSVNSSSNNGKVVSRVTKIQQKIEQITDDQQNQWSPNRKRKDNQNNTGGSSDIVDSNPQSNSGSSFSSLEGPAAQSSNQSIDASQSSSVSIPPKSRSSSTSQQTTTTTSTTQTSLKPKRTQITESPFTSLFNSILDFRLAPTFKQTWKPKSKSEIYSHFHLRHKL